MSRARACVLIGLALLATACGHRTRLPLSDYGIRPCPTAADDQLLSSDALQSWFTAPSGRWRTLSHESHYAVLVVNVEAADLDDAEAIARRFVEGERAKFSEILVYVQDEERTDDDIVRRIRWTLETGFEAFDFSVPSG